MQKVFSKLHLNRVGLVGYFIIFPIISLSTRVLGKSYSKIRFYPTYPTPRQKEEMIMESYVERWTREQKETAQKEKSRKRRKAVTEDVKNSRGEGQETQKAADR